MNERRRQGGRVTVTQAEIKRLSSHSLGNAATSASAFKRLVFVFTTSDFTLESSGPYNGKYRLDVPHNLGTQYVLYDIIERDGGTSAEAYGEYRGLDTLKLWFSSNAKNLTIVVI